MVHRFPFLTPSACVCVWRSDVPVPVVGPLRVSHCHLRSLTSIDRSSRVITSSGYARVTDAGRQSTASPEKDFNIFRIVRFICLSCAPLIKRTNSRNASVTKSCPFSVHHILVCCSRDVTETNISIMLLLEHNGAAYVRFISLTFAPKRYGCRTFCHPWQKMDDSPEWVTLKNGLCVHSRIYCLISSVLTTSFKRT